MHLTKSMGLSEGRAAVPGSPREGAARLIPSSDPIGMIVANLIESWSGQAPARPRPAA